MSSDAGIYSVIGNIPDFYHSVDLRNYFSMFIESGGFEIFHFRHRPEIQKLVNNKDIAASAVSGSETGVDDTTTSSSLYSSNSLQNAKTCHSSTINKDCKQSRTTCCVVKVRESRLEDLIRMYDRRHWLDKNGDSISTVCRITGVSVSTPSSTLLGFGTEYKTRKEQKVIPSDRENFTQSDLQKLPELHPPPVMPNGNVGTPTAIFLQSIKECKLPPSLIGKLGLRFPRKRTNKIYSNVHFDYGDELVGEIPGEEEEEVVTSASGHELSKEGAALRNAPQSQGTSGEPSVRSKDTKGEAKGRKKREKVKRRHDSSSEDEGKQEHVGAESDSDDCEDWERHEALHSDVAHHVERNKERLFEERIELKWEKGGSGLVFYTDAQYWDAKKGDFDERTADDWDVDMSIYTDPTAGDKDARDSMAMRQEKRRRQGLENSDVFTAGIGKFEEHTKGVGRRVMEKQGWKEGAGLGRSVEGISEALDNDGQKPWDRKGIGYTGEKLNRKGNAAAKKRRGNKDFIISTIYDNPAETDPPEPLYRSNDHHHLTYRHSFLQGGTEGGKGHQDKG